MTLEEEEEGGDGLGDGRGWTEQLLLREKGTYQPPGLLTHRAAELGECPGSRQGAGPGHREMGRPVPSPGAPSRSGRTEGTVTIPCRGQWREAGRRQRDRSAPFSPFLAGLMRVRPGAGSLTTAPLRPDSLRTSNACASRSNPRPHTLASSRFWTSLSSSSVKGFVWCEHGPRFNHKERWGSVCFRGRKSRRGHGPSSPGGRLARSSRGHFLPSAGPAESGREEGWTKSFQTTRSLWPSELARGSPDPPLPAPPRTSFEGSHGRSFCRPQAGGSLSFLRAASGSGELGSRKANQALHGSGLRTQTAEVLTWWL